MTQVHNGLSIDEIRELINKCHEGCVSIYIPTHQSGAETVQNPIRFKNTLREIAKELKNGGKRSPEVEKQLGPAYRLLADDRFWQYQGRGLAAFIGDGLFRFYKLPEPVEDLHVITDRFHIKPLLPVLMQNSEYYVLGLSQGQLALYRGDRFRLEELDVDEIPGSLAEALQYDDPEKQLQFHTGTRQAGKGGRQPIFHGHGVETDKSLKEEIRRYFHQVNNGLHKFLGPDNRPLVLAGVDYLIPIYRDVNSYPHLVDRAIIGNPQRMIPKELHESAWNIVRERFDEQIESDKERFQNLKGTGRTSDSIEEIVPASHQGRVEILFSPVGVHAWGTFDEETGRTDLHAEYEPGDEDMLDLAAIYTYSNGGTVHVVKPEVLPSDSLIGAVFRY